MTRLEYLQLVFSKKVYYVRYKTIYRKGGHALQEGVTYHLSYRGVHKTYTRHQLLHFNQTGELPKVGFTEREIRQIKVCLELKLFTPAELAVVYKTSVSSISLIKTGKKSAHKEI